MTKYAICFVTDEGYTLPTIVAARQARALAPEADVDVFIFAVGLDPVASNRYRSICLKAGIRLTEVTREIFGDVATNDFIDEFFAGSPFTFGTLGRLFLDQLLAEEYTQILYLDGDLGFNGGISELLRFKVPDGCFLAGPDPKVFWMHADNKAGLRERRYMTDLGIPAERHQNYFNAGVLRINREGWRQTAASAWAYLNKYPERCVNHDQSALNAVSGDKHLPMSLGWNFPAYLRHYGLRETVKPHITHFMSRPKPWNGVFPPWGKAEHKIYTDFIAQNPDVAEDLPLFGFQKTAKYALQQRVKWLDELIHVKRRREFRAGVERYEAKIKTLGMV